MLRWIIGSSLQFRFILIILAAVLMLYGISELHQDASVDIFPEFNPPMVEIQTEALGLSAAEMEALITVPMEADLLNGVAWLDQIYSESVTGMSSILLIFEPGTDPIAARQMVQERLTQTFALPNVSTPPTMLQPLSTTGRVMVVGLSSEELSLIELSILARWNIKPRLMGVPGVANVNIWGHREWQLQVQVDPEHLRDKGVTLRQVIQTTGEALWVSPLSYLEASTPGTAGWIDTPNQRLSIRHILPITSPESLAQVPIVGSEDLVLSDVANVVDDHQPLIGDALLGENPGLLLVIEKFPGADITDVTKGVEDALDEMAPGLTGVAFDTTVFRPASYIEEGISNLTTAIIVGAVLMILVLGVFFMDWRSALISFVTVPLALAVTAFVLHARGTPFNVIVLAGLVVALGVIIDDAITDVENVTRRLRKPRPEGDTTPTDAIVLNALLQVRSPIIYAILVILLTVMPFFLLGGLPGSFLEPFASSYALAVSTSLVVTLVVTPALTILVFSNAPIGRREPPLAQMLQHSYKALLAQVVRIPAPVFVAAGVVIVIGIAGLFFMDRSLMPSFKQTDLLITVEAVPGTSRNEMNRIMSLVSSDLQTIKGVRNVGSHVGRAVTGDQVVEINSGEIWVSLDPSVDYDKTVNAVSTVIDGYPGLAYEVQTYLPERIDEALMQTEEDIVVRVYGHEFDVLENTAVQIQEDIRGIDGIDDVEIDFTELEPQVEIEVDIAAAERYGLKPGDVRRAAATLLSGLPVGSLYQEQKIFDVVVWGEPHLRDSLTDIHNLLIDTPTGDQVRLGEVAAIRIVPTPIVIQRDAVSRFVDIEVHVSGRSIGSVASDIDRRLEDIEFPFEYHAKVLGEYAEREATRWRVLGAAIIAVIGTFLLLQASFDSWRLAFVTLLALPMALTGGVLAAFLVSDVTIGSLFGLLAVLGIAVRNGITLFDHYRNLQLDENQPWGPELVLQGAQDRLVPILMTALTTGFVQLPLIVGGTVPGLEIAHPIAVVILGGLITSTLLSLFVLPTVYLRFGAAVPVSDPSSVSASQQPGLEVAR